MLICGIQILVEICLKKKLLLRLCTSEQVFLRMTLHVQYQNTEEIQYFVDSVFVLKLFQQVANTNLISVNLPVVGLQKP